MKPSHAWEHDPSKCVPSEDADARIDATIDHYESDDLPSGSIAVLSDGRRLVTAKAFETIWHIYCMYRKVN